MASGRVETKAPVSETNALQEVSGTLSLVVETALVVVNLFPILVVMRGKKFKERTVTDELVVALSVTDILAVLIPTPVALMSYFDQNWQGGYETCVFFQVTTQCFQTVSVLLVTYMCLDRFLVLRKALYYKIAGVYSADKVKFFVLILYGVSLGVGSMPVSGLAPVPISRNACESWITAMPGTRIQATFYLTILSLGYLNMILVILLNICVVSLVWKLKRKMQPLRGRTAANHIPELQIERKTIFEYSWMTLTVAVLFYLTWFPAMMMLTLQKAGLNISDVAVLYAFLSTTLTGLLNPLIYGLFSKTYRRGYKQIISAIAKCLCKCPKRDFEPVPAIACERHVYASDDLDNMRKSRNYLKKSKSFHDKPLRGGFQNHAIDTSVHSELSGYEETERFRRKHSDGARPKRLKGRTRSLTLSDNNVSPSADNTGSYTPRKLSSSNSSLSSSDGTDGPEKYSADSDDEMDKDELNSHIKTKRNSTVETAI